MLLKIGIIGSSSSLQKISKSLPLLKEKVESTLIECNEIDKIKKTYDRNHSLHHCIVFGGSLGIKEIMDSEYSESESPIYYLDYPENEFYKKLFEISNYNKKLDFSRVIIDFINSSNNYYGLHDVLKSKEFPYTCENLSFAHQFNEIIETHISLWKKGLTDLSITHIGSITNKLEKEGIPTIFMYPSQYSIVNQLTHIITDVQLFYLKENQPCFGSIMIDKADNSTDIEMKEIMLHKALLEYNKENPSLIIQKNPNLEIIISYGDLKEITKNFSCCFLQQYLQKTLKFKVNIGWGIGKDLHQAKLNAVNANKEAAHNFPGNSIIITASNEVIGPLGLEICHSYFNTTNTQFEKLSNILGITTLQINKIISILDKQHSNELAADDLAYHLGVTSRTANRILNKLEEKGAADVKFTKQEKLRGRPKKIYAVDLSKFIID